MNVRKSQIQLYKQQLALTDALRAEAWADMENDEKIAAFDTAAGILRAMNEAGYAPRSFGVADLETGDATPEEIEEWRAARFA